MSGLECLCLACWGATCLVWGCKRCCNSGRDVSRDWEEATPEEFHDVPRVCRIVLSAYEKDIENPIYADKLNPDQVVKRADYKDNDGMCPPYLIYIDHDAKDICLAIRGLNMANFPDYRTLLDHKKGSHKFDGGYVHSGLLKSASWVLDKEFALLEELAVAHPEYTVTFAGHSLGSGIAAMMGVLVQKNIQNTSLAFGRLRCYAIAPARSTSLNLAVRYADIINSIILQDDFLPRTSAPIETILGASCCLPCFLCSKCCEDIWVSDEQKLKDPRRLYVPGRLYHILYTKDFSCKNTEPIVLTAVPVDKRFEHIIFSRTTIDDHSIVHIEKEADKAVLVMAANTPPQEQRMDSTLERKRMEQVVHSLQKCQTMGVNNPKDPAEVAAVAEATPAASWRREVDKEEGHQGAEEGRDEEKGEKEHLVEKSEEEAEEGKSGEKAESKEGKAEQGEAMQDGGERAEANGRSEEAAALTGSMDAGTGNGHQGEAEGGVEGVLEKQETNGSVSRKLRTPSELEEVELEPKALPVAQRWKEAVRKVQMKQQSSSSRWGDLLGKMLKESGEDLSPEVAREPKPNMRLHGIAITGAP